MKMKLFFFLFALVFCSNITVIFEKMNDSNRNYTVFVENLETKRYINIFTNVATFQSQFDIQTKVKIIWYSLDMFTNPELVLFWILNENWKQKVMLNDFGLFSSLYNKERFENFHFVMNTNRKMFDGGIFMEENQGNKNV